MVGLGGISGVSKRKLYKIMYNSKPKGFQHGFLYASHFILAESAAQARREGLRQIKLEHPKEKVTIEKVALYRK